jgi:putative phage-type endonuclease
MAAPLLYDATGRTVDGIDPEYAVEILPYGVDRQRWLAVRRTGLGSSNASTLVGLNKYESRTELWEDKAGNLPLVNEQSEEAEMGTLLEPVVRDRFARVHDLDVRLAGTLRSTRWPWMLANPDGLCSDGAGFEAKTCGPFQAEHWADGQVPDHAELQSQWCMAVTGLPRWHVACLIAGQRNVYRLVERDNDLIGDLVQIGHDFWHGHVLAGQPPAVDGSAACTAFLAAHYPNVLVDEAVEVGPAVRDELVRAKEKSAQAEKDAKRDHDEVKNRARRLIGDRLSLECDGETVATWAHIDKLDAKRFQAGEPELAATYTRPVERVELDVAALKTDHPETYRAYRQRQLRFAN